MTLNQPLRPGPFAERQIIRHILEGRYQPGTLLPSERKLAETLGVTRQTIREALQRLAGEGWLTIRHGKATEVNDFWKTGGIRLLGTLVNFSSSLPGPVIEHLLELRVIFTPPVAQQAAQRAPGPIARHLEQARGLEDEASAYSGFDWQLQELMASLSGNPVHLMMLNDFRAIFQTMAEAYFSEAYARRTSLAYYRGLHRAVTEDPAAVGPIVKKAMLQSIEIWKQIKPTEKEGGNEPMERLGG